MTHEKKQQISSLFDGKFIVHFIQEKHRNIIYVMDLQGKSCGKLSGSNDPLLVENMGLELHVDKQERSKGYGTTLLMALEQIAAYLSVTTVWLHVELNSWHPEWLIRKGYNKAGVSYIQDKLIVMTKSISPL